MNVRNFLSRALMIWGALSLAFGVALFAYIAYQIGPGNAVEVDQASPHDVRFVLNWCGLGEHRIKRVAHSHVSPRSLTGDHLDAYAIEITDVQIQELIKKDSEQHWYPTNAVPPVLDDSIEFMGQWLSEVPWFPSKEELRSGGYYVYPWRIEINGIRPTAVQLIFVRPSDKMIFYFSGKV